MAQRLGTDLSVVPNLVAQDAMSLDLTTRVRPRRRPPPGAPPELRDLASTDGRENLAQALLLRLLTPRGALGPLGHGDYGSRLGELIGRRKTDELRNLCRAFVLEALAGEPRVEAKAVVLEFDRDEEDSSSFVFTLAVRPRDGGEAVGLSLEVGL
jgi:phage baseplate assembly protein W